MSRLRIGLCSQGDERWAAGVIYLQNLVRACVLLPEEERPEFHFISELKAEVVVLRELGAILPPLHAFSHRKASPPLERWRAASKSLRRGHWPISLESLATRLKLTALFPLQSSLGEKFPVPWIGWIPDFQHKRLPHYFSDEELKRRDREFQQLIRECSHLVVSSQDSDGDLMRWFEADKNRASILRFHAMIDPRWLEGAAEQTARTFQLPEKYLMFPSQFWVHKNHERLLQALSIVKREGARDVAVVFTGFQKDYRKPGHFTKIQNLTVELGLQPNVHYLGLLPRHDQVQLLRRAAAIVQPSYCEGWSSLVEDCRSLGKRIYLSDLPIHREQDPPNAVFFNPDRAEELAAHLKRDWDSLAPGPNWVDESQALVQSRERGIRFARDFLNIIARAVR
jgi:glycosyltransferase involved in cell wall biosynthesis